MPLYNPLPQLMNRPQGMQGLAMLGGALSNIQRQKQAQAQQQATGQALGSLATYGMEDQEKAQALSQLAEANPQMFMQYQQMQNINSSRGRDTQYNEQELQYKQQLNQLERAIVQANDEDLESLFVQYDDIVSRHNSLPHMTEAKMWKGSPSQLMNKRKEDQNLKRQGLELKKEQWGLDKQIKNLGLKTNQQDAIYKISDKWRSVNKTRLGTLETIKKIENFIPEAKKGNTTARKNLIASISRLGSDEALSDGELNIMLAQDIESKLEGFKEMFGDGNRKITSKDVENAIKLYNTVKEQSSQYLDDEISRGARRMSKYGVDDEAEVRSLLLGGLRDAESFNPYGSVDKETLKEGLGGLK